MAGFTGSWTDSVGGGVGDAYSFDPSRNTNGWGGFFGDALGAYVGLEALKVKSEATASGQDATRNGVTTPTGEPAYQGGSTGGGGLAINGQTLAIGGVLIAAAFLLMK